MSSMLTPDSPAICQPTCRSLGREIHALQLRWGTAITTEKRIQEVADRFGDQRLSIARHTISGEVQVAGSVDHSQPLATRWHILEWLGPRFPGGAT